MGQLFTSGSQTIGASASASVLAMNIQDWFPLGWTGWISLQSKGLSRVISNTTVQSINSSAHSFLYSPTLTFIHAAAAKSLQSWPTLCDLIDGSPPGSPVPGILQARTLEWVAISFSNAWKWKVKVKSLSHAQLFSTPWTAAHQAPLSVGFSRQEHWGGLPLPSPFIYDYWKNHGSDYLTFVDKIMSLLLNTLSRLVIAFLQETSVLISWLQSPSAVNLEPQK